MGRFVIFIGVSDCSEICYKDPVLKDRQWSAYIDRSPGSASYSEECFHACVAGCGYKFEVESEEVNKVKPNRPPPPPPKPQPPPRAKRPMQPPSDEDVPASSSA
ncbi:Defensin-like protein [Hirschfeldia incana]|nr:Defensin-like protein [Hirschfeldia incana]